MGKDYLLDYEAAVTVNGDAQNIRVRAAKEGLPVMLFLHGGPGVPDRHNVITNRFGPTSTTPRRSQSCCAKNSTSERSSSPPIPGALS